MGAGRGGGKRGKTRPFFWPKMVFAGPFFGPIIYFLIFCRCPRLFNTMMKA